MISLKNILLANGVSSLATGVVLCIFPKPASFVFGLQIDTVLFFIGLFLVAFSVLVLHTALQKSISLHKVKLITALDVFWVLASIIVLITAHSQIRMIGIAIILIVLQWVAFMAWGQIKCIKSSRNNSGYRQLITGVFMIILTSNTQAQQASVTTNAPVSPLGVTQEFLTSIKQMNSAKARPVMDSLMEWHQPGSNKFSGVKKNRKEVFAMYRDFMNHTDGTLRLIDSEIIGINGTTVACRLKWLAYRPDGEKLDVENIDLYTVQNGKIIKVVIFSFDIKLENEFWGK